MSNWRMTYPYQTGKLCHSSTTYLLRCDTVIFQEDETIVADGDAASVNELLDDRGVVAVKAVQVDGPELGPVDVKLRGGGRNPWLNMGLAREVSGGGVERCGHGGRGQNA